MYNWKKYNSKKLSLAKFFITHNKKIFLIIVKNRIILARSYFCLGLISLKNQEIKIYSSGLWK